MANLAALCLAASSCTTKSGPDSSTSVEGTGTLIQSMADLQPSALPGEEAQMVYGGTKVPVRLSQRRSDNELSLTISAHEETSDVEVYRVGDDRFSLVNAAGELYDPPIDLLRFPFRIGSSWTWEGKMTTGGLAKEATAKIVTGGERLFPESVSMEAVKVAVQLEIEANPPDGPVAKRELTFWFVEGKGVVRRAFGAASVREPRQDP